MLLITNREELLDLFDKCGALVRYHHEAAKVAFVCDRNDVEYHMNMAKTYLSVREDLLRILTEGS